MHARHRPAGAGPWLLDRDRAGKRKLQDLCLHYEVAEEADLHTAEVDVVATLDVLARIADRFPQLARAPLAEVHRWQTAWHRDWATAVNSRRSDHGRAGPGVNPAWPMPVTVVGAPALT